MTPAMAFGAAGAMAGVVALWEALAIVEHARVVAAVRRVMAPLRAAGLGGALPSTPERVRLGALCVTAAVAAGWLLGGPMLGLLLGALGPWIPSRALTWRRRRWLASVARGAPAAARSIADALGGGHSVRGALSEAARAGGCGPATDAELRSCAASLALGARTDEVLEALRRRVPCAAWDTVVAAILLQRDAGGDLAALLRELARDLEAGARVEADAQAATAQARFTGWLVAALPAAGAALTELGSPGTLARIAGQPLALTMAAAALVLQLLGIAAIRRLAAE